MPGDFKAYPVTVKPIFKEQIWGGKKLKSYISLPDRKKIGEAWFLADQEGNHSIISNGKYAGMPIGGLIKKYPEEVLGEKLIKKYGEKFPLLFKYIDAGDCLSVQVHPDDKTAEKIEKGVGKTEMWYVLEAKKTRR